jgi:hypothetical protein
VSPVPFIRSRTRACSAPGYVRRDGLEVAYLGDARIRDDLDALVLEDVDRGGDGLVVFATQDPRGGFEHGDL